MDCLSDCETMKTNSSNLGKRNYQLTLSRRKIALVQQQLVWKWYGSDLVASIRILVRWRYRPLIGKINCQSIYGTQWERLWRAFPSLVLKIEQHRQQDKTTISLTSSFQTIFLLIVRILSEKEMCSIWLIQLLIFLFYLQQNCGQYHSGRWISFIYIVDKKNLSSGR